MFKAATDKYSKFDEQGIPTHNAAGEELSKKQRQGVEKDFAKRTADFAKVMSRDSRLATGLACHLALAFSRERRRLGAIREGPAVCRVARLACLDSRWGQRAARRMWREPPLGVAATPG